MTNPPSAEERARVQAIVAALHAQYPDPKSSLNFSSPLELLVATILAAQCTDERVNKVTATLFVQFPTVIAYATAPIEQLEQAIKSINFYRNKAKNIQAMAQMLQRDYGGMVPSAMDDLLRLPGVARKTANVVQGNAFQRVEGVVVDTHVGRIARRLGLTTEEDPVKVERDLMVIVDQKDWLDFSHMLIYLGRATCKAPKPLCHACGLAQLCPTGKATLGA